MHSLFFLRGEDFVKVPLIGVTTFIEGNSYRLPKYYGEAIIDCGGVSVLLVKTLDEDKVRKQVESIDGLILAGGDDIDPAFFGEGPHQKLGSIEPGRDEYEMLLIKFALEMNKPILGICRGSQILNIAEGGTMYQDIYSQMDDVYQHTQNAPVQHMSHFIDIEKGSKLHEIMGEETIKINSFHHQANKDVGAGYKIVAKSKDGVVEAFESLNHDFVVGVQWHPECTYSVDEHSQRLFHRFIDTARG